MARARQRRLHVPIDPPFVVALGDRTVSFVGLMLLRGHVMVEYDVTPPFRPRSPFGPHLLVLEVRDDVDGEEYPTFWHDFYWPHIAAGRMTTRLERRPPAAARKLRFTVRPSEPAGADGRVPTSSSLPALAEFEVALPPDHALPWPT